MKNDLFNIFYDNHLSQETMDFVETSKITSYGAMEYGKHIAVVNNTSYFAQHIAYPYSERSAFETIPLSKPVDNQNSGLFETFKNKKSQRTYTDKLSFQALSTVLHGADHVISEIWEPLPHKRNYASGGGCYPIDIFYINLKTETLPTGVFYYHPVRSELQVISQHSEEKLQEYINNIFFSLHRSDIDFGAASGIIVLGGMLRRIAFKYKDRGLRLAMIDAGAITQNIYLTCAEANIGCCACAGYIDDQLAELVGLSNPDEVPLNAIVIGKI